MRKSTITFLVATILSTAACGPRDKDKLDDSQLGETATTANGKNEDADTRCTTRAATDEVKRQLFARAAQIRGSNGDNYAKIAGFALIDIEGAAPLAAVSSGESVDCRGHATLRLPAGLKVAGGRTTLGGDINYNVAPGARGEVTLGQSDSISIPLATLTQKRTAARAPTTGADPVSSPQVAEVEAEPAPRPRPQPQPPVQAERPPAPRPVPEPVTTAAARPSFNCRSARTAGERAVCASPSLAALDRSMAAQYRSAVANGGPQDRALLVQTRDRFLGYRDRCRSDSCIAEVYRGRMREIDDIVAGRWRGQR